MTALEIVADECHRGVDWVQENVLKQGKQDNESAVEQAKDEQISDFIRKQYKGTTGKDFPVQDKETRLGESAALRKSPWAGDPFAKHLSKKVHPMGSIMPCYRKPCNKQRTLHPGYIS